MPTETQLRAEPWWGREIVTPELDWLGDEMCRRTGQPRTAAGTKGNERHLRGSHRSQEWIKNSRYCTDRRYTVQSGLTPTQQRHIAGFDFTPGVWGTAENRRRMIQQSKRIIAAMKAGELDEVREFYGTVDGRTVTGWNNVENRAASANSSHLDHWHAGLDRRHCNKRGLMERIVRIALGLDTPAKPSQEDDMAYSEAQLRAFPWQYNGRGIADNDLTPEDNISTLGVLNFIYLTVKKLAESQGVPESELAQIRAAAQQGAQQALAESIDDIVAGVVAELNPEDLTVGAVEQAVRNVLLHGAAAG